MKKIFSIILSLVMVISICTFQTKSIYAQDFSENDISNQFINNNMVIDEYELYKSLISKTDNELLSEGYDKMEIDYIRNFDYEKEVMERANLSEDVLKSYGYSENEIRSLKEMSKSKTFSANVLKSISRNTLGSSIRVKKTGYLTENNKKIRYADLLYMFQWKRVPLFLLQDLVVIAFDSNNSSKFSYKKVSGYNLSADLTNLKTNKKLKQTINWKYDTKSNKAVSAKFPIAIKNADGTVSDMCWSGSGYIRLTNASKSSRLYIDACYGHTTINIEPSFSINISGTSSIGVSFRKGMDSRHDCGLYYSDFSIDDSYIYYGVVKGV